MDSKAKPKSKIKLFKIVVATFKQWLGEFNNYTKLVLVVALPVAALTILQADGNTGDFGLTMAFAWSFTIIALITYSTKKTGPKDAKIAGIYSAASGRFLQYLGVSLIMIFFAAPAVAGWLGILTALTQQQSNSLILLALGATGLVLSVYLLVRFSLAQVITVGFQKTVLQSLKDSSKLTKGNRLKVFIGFFILLLLVFLIANGIQLLLSLSRVVNENTIINNMVYVIEATIFLPILYVFQVKLYEALNG